jgi:hypothetical protein
MATNNKQGCVAKYTKNKHHQLSKPHKMTDKVTKEMI